jgi:hypothetical protein
VEELAAALGSGSSLVRTERGLELDAGATVPIPETIRDAVRLRTERLSDDAERVLEAAAAAGTLFDLELLSALGEDAGLGEVLERGLLGEVEPGIAAFRHDLVPEALYADTPWPRRRALHCVLAEQLEPRTVDRRQDASARCTHTSTRPRRGARLSSSGPTARTSRDGWPHSPTWAAAPSCVESWARPPACGRSSPRRSTLPTGFASAR